MDFIKKTVSSVPGFNKSKSDSPQTQSTIKEHPPLPYPDNKTPEELGIKLEEGPNFDSLYNPDAPVDNPLNVPDSIKKLIDDYIDSKIITKEDEETYGLSSGFRGLLSLYRNATKFYFLADYITNYNAASFVKE